MKVIILAGGSGTRLWPLSREKYPKQFVKLFNEKYSLFQETYLRSLNLCSSKDIFIVTNEAYKHLVIGEIEEIGFKIEDKNIIVEPIAKNTLPAIIAGVKIATEISSDTIVIFPSDHKILKSKEFINIINESTVLSRDSIITFGIVPNSPNTGYGYIQPGDILLNGFRVNSFKEKPVVEKAIEYINNGYFWNAGIFMFDSNVFLNECRILQNEMLEIFENNPIDDAFWKIKEGISIDYGILEKSKIVATVPTDIGWNDLGSFDSFYDVLESDGNNYLGKDDISINSNNNVFFSDSNRLIASIGLNDMIVIDTKDSLLICRKDQSQDVKKIINILKERNDLRLSYHVQDYRPWGNYRVLEEEKNEFKIKRIVVEPGKKISYQYHKHRSEHWVVVRGVATILIDDIRHEVPAGESVYIKPLQKHRLINNTDKPIEIIEVQLGDYLEEDDIIRLDDDFNRK